MKILVTGSAGQLAQSLAELAPNEPGVDLLALGRPWLDLAKPGSAAAEIVALAPNVVINSAAYTAVDQAEEEPERAFRINAEAAGEVATAAARVGAGFVQISTDYVFDGLRSGAYDEQAPLNPLSVYGRSKLAGEEMVRAANSRHIIVRAAWIYSPFGHNFLKSIMAAASKQPILRVVDDQHGNPTCSLDLAGGLLAMIKQDRGWGETYHLSGSGSTSWCGFAREIMACCAELGLPYAEVQPISSEDWPTRAVRPRNSVLDCRKFAREFGYVMPKWESSVARVVKRLAAESSRHRSRVS